MSQPHSLGLILLLCISLCSETVNASPQPTPLTPTPQQRTQSNTSDSNRAAAEKAEAEARQLEKQNAPLSSQVIPKWEEALKYWRLAKDHKKEAAILSEIAGLYFLRGEYPKGSEYAQKALPICQLLKDTTCEAVAAGYLAVNYDRMGEYQKAIEMALKKVSLLGDDPTTFTFLGQIYGKTGEKQKALDYYNKALAFWKQKGDAINQAEELEYLALFYSSLGEINQSIETIVQANSLDPEFKRKSLPAYEVLRNFSCADKLATIKKPPKIDKSESSSNQPATPDNDIEKIKEQAQKWRRQENLTLEALSLLKLGLLPYRRIGEYEKALEVLQQLLKLRKMMGDKPGEAKTLTYIAEILNEQGKKQEAINSFNQALDIQRQIKTRPEEVYTLNALGDVYFSLGAYPESLKAYNQALSLSQIIGNRRLQITTLSNIGSVYRKLQKYQKSQDYAEQANFISHETGNCNDEVGSLIDISNNYISLGNYQQAMTVGNHALDLSRNLDELKLVREATVLEILAKVEIKQGNYSKSLEYAQSARKVARESGYKQREAYALTNTAQAYAALKQPEKAIEAYQEQLALYIEMGLSSEQAQSLYNIAKLQRENNQLPAALT